MSKKKQTNAPNRTVWEYGVEQEGHAVMVWASREAAERIIEKRKRWHREWHPGCGYGQGEYADPGTLVRRKVVTYEWRPVK